MKNVYSNYFYNVGNSEYIRETAVTLDQYIAIERLMYFKILSQDGSLGAVLVVLPSGWASGTLKWRN
jgi:hypothetical protein